MNLKRLIFCFGLMICSTAGQAFTTETTQAEDTLRLDIKQAEKILLDQNLELLASRYSIKSQEALIRQARLWDNPMLNTDQNIYDGKFFRHQADHGQVFIQVMQLFLTAGKRSKAVEMAKDNASISMYQLDDLLRNLRYALHADFAETRHLLEVQAMFREEIQEVNQLVEGMRKAYETGDIALKDKIRIEAMLHSLKNDLSEADTRLIELQKEIRTLLRVKDQVFIAPVYHEPIQQLASKSLNGIDSLQQIAFNYRPDLHSAEKSMEWQKHNLVYQKALAVPDVSAGVEYDRLSSYTPNYVGLAVSVPIPLLNRNQGNIESARYALKAQEATRDFARVTVENEVQEAYRKVLYYQKMNQPELYTFTASYESLFQNMLNSYRERQISLLELVDYIDAYKESKLNSLNQQHNLAKAFAYLNYVLGKDQVSLN